MDRRAVRQVRAFNRTVAERIGALNEEFLGRGRPMGESRTLWEIGVDGAEVRELRARLGLDSGYLSRVLRSLEADGLISIQASPEDGRVRQARLTTAGRAERAELDRRSDAVASSFLSPLDDRQRTRLVAAMSEVERLLRASMVSMALEDPTTPDARWCIEQYFAELQTRFDAGFDPARSISAAEHELVPPAGVLLVARLREQPIGCGALKFHAAELERLAQDAGASVVRLETNRALGEAIQLYRSSGYREVPAFNDEPYAHHWFEKRLAESPPRPA